MPTPSGGTPKGLITLSFFDFVRLCKSATSLRASKAKVLSIEPLQMNIIHVHIVNNENPQSYRDLFDIHQFKIIVLQAFFFMYK